MTEKTPGWEDGKIGLSNRHPVRVLLVEDDEEDFLLTRELLWDIGKDRFHIDWAESFEAGLAAAAKQEHDIYLVDYRLGPHEGVEFLRHPHLEGKPVIMLTGFDDPDTDLKAMEAGAVDYLVKGRIDASLLERSIRYAIERKRIEAQLRRAQDELERRVQERTAELETANEALREKMALHQRAEKKFRELLESAPDAMVIVDGAGKIVLVNGQTERVFGFQRAELIGKSMDVLVPESMQGDFLQHWTGETSGQDPRAACEEIQLAGVRRDGSTFPVEISLSPLETEEGLLISSAIRDVTERKQYEAALKDADRRKDEFLAMLAHELRNPLAPIRTGLELIRLAQGDPSTIDEVRGIMERQTQQLITLVDDLLDVSRITRGKLQLRKRRVELQEVIQSAVEATRPFIDEAHHELTLSLSSQPIPLKADPHRLAQVFSNLLNNAAKYTPENGRIDVSVDCHENQVVVAVRDTGIGIPREKLELIFEMFGQIDHPLQRATMGLGIGLTLVRSLVEMHGGQIEVSSEGPDQGSEFRVHLPILMETAPEATPVDAPAEEVPSSKLRVLVVDDNVAAAKMLGMSVKMLGNEVRTAGDGQEAIEIAADFQPDVVLMDIGMPRMNGYEAARYIRQQPWGQKMFLIALTGWGQEEDKRQTMEAGFDHHLVKPAEPDELQELLASVEVPN